ncbi:very short patch repair endonuclease [Tsuneonella sp. HG222]
MTKRDNGPLTRSETMARVRSKDTSPELALRRALHAAGLRYRLHARLPGSPDIVFGKARLAVFVHGCFWHSHDGCKRARIPSTRQDYWIPKLKRNVERDQASIEALIGLGWRVIVAWECELSGERLARQVAEVIRAARMPV